MAFYDWNHNGKKDVQDDFIEYNMERRLVLYVHDMNRASISKQDIVMFQDEKKQKR